MRAAAYKYYKASRVIEPQRQQMVLPAFELPVPLWAGASTVLAQYNIENSEDFSLRLPVDAFGANFVLAVRWLVDTDVWARYVLWEDDAAVLNYPVYSGQRIGANAVLEVWSVDSEETPALEDDYVFETSVLVYPYGQTAGNCTSCCSNASSVLTLTAVAAEELPPGASCNPFCGDLCNTPTPMPTCDCPTVVQENVQDGRDYEPAAFITPSLMTVLGGLVPGDGLGKVFYWDAASTAVDTGDETTTVIRPTSIGSLAPGRWLQYI